MGTKYRLEIFTVIFGQGTVLDYWEHSNELTGSIKGKEFLD